MRILLISDVYFPRINGVSTSIESFRQALAEENIDTRLIAPAYPAMPTGTGDAGILRVASRRVPFDPEDRLMRWRELRRRLESLAPPPCDLVHVQTPFAAHFAGLAHARRHRLPCLATYHTHFEEYLHNYAPRLPAGLLRATARRAARWQCNALDAVIVPSSAMEETLLGYGVKTPLHRVPTGIPVEKFAVTCRSASAEFRHRFEIPESAPLALYVGRVAHEKNIDFLLEAFVRARRDLPALMLVIAGEGPALPALRRQAATLGIMARVRFVGYLDRKNELPACYAAADLFVFASRTETQGLVLLEAMAAGLPVLALAHLGTREIVEPCQGALPGPSTSQEFGAAMAMLLADAPRRGSMSEAARRFVRQWTTSACGRRLAGVYRQVLEQYAERRLI